MLDPLDVFVHDGGHAPVRAHETDAGLDLFTTNDVIVTRWETTMADLGVSVAIPAGYVGLLVERSSTHTLGVGLDNKAGVIDPEYRGVLKAPLGITGKRDTVLIPGGTKLVQLLVVPVATPAVNLVNNPEDLGTTARGAGGFGSTNQ